MSLPRNAGYLTGLGVYISQLIRISRICDKFANFVKRHRLLTDRLMKQGFWYIKGIESRYKDYF